MKFDIFFSFMLPYIIIDSRNINRSVLTFFMIEYPCLTSVKHFKFFLVVPPGNTLELYEVRISFGKVFSLFMGMTIPQGGEIGTGKIPPSSLKAHNIFPTHATPFVGKILCAFCDSGGILFFTTRREKSCPYFSTLRDWHIHNQYPILSKKVASQYDFFKKRKFTIKILR